MTQDEVRALLQDSGLARVAGELIRRAGPTVRIYIEPADEDSLPLGSSRLGGTPDLPRDMEWPTWHVPMAFIGQLNLADAVRAVPNAEIPIDGLLAFFFETDGEPLYSAQLAQPGVPLHELAARNDRRAWRALHVPSDPSQLERRLLPDAVDPGAQYQACLARFVAEVTLPYPDDPVLEGLDLTRHEESALLSLLYEPMWPLNRGTFDDGGHHLLGYPYLLGGDDPRVLAAQRADAERGLAQRWRDAAPAGVQQLRKDAMRTWQLLLQVDSSSDTNMDWAGGGLIHWCIERDALRRADFSTVWLDLQFL